MPKLCLLLLSLTALGGFINVTEAQAQQPSSETFQLQQRVKELESRVTRISRMGRDTAEIGLILFLRGTFCALWAQNTGRSALLWFFLGFFFHVITLIVLLSKNSQQPTNGFNIQDYRRQ